jgi:hypothetical protein
MSSPLDDRSTPDPPEEHGADVPAAATQQLLQRLAWHGEIPQIAAISSNPAICDCVRGWFAPLQVSLGIHPDVRSLADSRQRCDCAIVDVSDGTDAIAAMCQHDVDIALLGIAPRMPVSRFAATLEAGAVDALPCPADSGRLARALVRAGNVRNSCPFRGNGSATEDTLRRVASELARWETLPNLGDIGDLLVQEALRRSDRVIARSARLLGVTPQAIHNRLRRSGPDAAERLADDVTGERPARRRQTADHGS